MLDGNRVSIEQRNLWAEFKKLRNKVINNLKHEEVQYKRNKFLECNGSSSKVWGLAKNFMEWSSPGPPIQLQCSRNNSIVLVAKAAEIAKDMNSYFIQNMTKKYIFPNS